MAFDLEAALASPPPPLDTDEQNKQGGQNGFDLDAALNTPPPLDEATPSKGFDMEAALKTPPPSLNAANGQETPPVRIPADDPNQKPWGMFDSLKAGIAGVGAGIAGEGIPFLKEHITSPVERSGRQMGLAQRLANTGSSMAETLTGALVGPAGAGLAAGYNTLASNAEQRRIDLEREADQKAMREGTLTPMPVAVPGAHAQSWKDTDAGDVTEAAINGIITSVAMGFGGKSDAAMKSAIAQGVRPLVATGVNVLKQAGFDAATAIPSAIAARANAENMTLSDWSNPEKVARVLDPQELLKEAGAQAALSVGAQIPGTVKTRNEIRAANEPVLTPAREAELQADLQADVDLERLTSGIKERYADGRAFRPEDVGANLNPKGGDPNELPTREGQGQAPGRPFGLGPLRRQSQAIAATPDTAGEGVINLRGQEVLMPGQPVRRLGVNALGKQNSINSDPDVKAIGDAITTSRDMRNVNLPKFTDRLRTELFDKFRPIQKLSQAAEKSTGEKLKAIEDPYKVFRGLNRKIIGTVNKAMTQGLPRFNSKEVSSPSLREVLAPVKGNLDDFDKLLAARRTPEMAKRQESLPFDEAQAARATEKLLAQPGMAEAAENYDKFTDAGLQYVLDSGLKTPEEIDQIRNANTLYAPWERVDEDGNIRLGTSPAPGRRPDQPGDPLKRVTAEGSKKNLVSPLETSIKNTVQLVAAAEKNAAKRQMVDVAGKSPELAEFAVPIDAEELSRISPSKVITVKRNGQTEYYQVDPEIKKTLEGLTPEEADMFDKIMVGFANAFRGSITLDPPFAVNNFVRDAWQQSVISRSAKLPIPFQNQARGLGLLATKKGRNTWKEWYDSAANQAIEHGAIMDRRGLLEDMSRQAHITPNVLFNKENINPKNWPHLFKRSVGLGIRGLNRTMQVAESAGRVGEYDRVKKQSLKKGFSEQEARAEAEFESADLGDFSMGGRNKKIQAARRYIPFFGSTLSFGYREAGSLKSPKVLLSAMTSIGGMEALNFYLNHDDPDYWNLPDDQRRRYWHIPSDILPFDTDGKKFVAIPKPVGLIGYAFSEPIRNLLDKYVAGADPSAADFVWNLFGNLLPPEAPAPIKTAVELATDEGGYSYFYDRPIVSRGLQNLPPEMQYTDRTSLTARKIGLGLNSLGIPASPQKIDYAIGSGMGSGVRRVVETVVDPAIAKVTGERVPGQPLGISLTKRNYFSPEDKGSEAIDEFYEKLDRLEKAAAASKAGGEHESFDPGELKRMRKKASKLSDKRKELQKYVGNEEKQREIKRAMVAEIKGNVKEEMPPDFSQYQSRPR